MNRRHFMLTTAAISLTPFAAFAATGWIDYEEGKIQQLLGEGKTVFVDYSATWCSTCAAQGRTIDALRDANPSYDSNMVFVRVDWDTYSRHAVTTSRNIPRRSTLLVLKGDHELGRVVAGTSQSVIMALMDLGV